MKSNLAPDSGYYWYLPHSEDVPPFDKLVNPCMVQVFRVESTTYVMQPQNQLAINYESLKGQFISRIPEPRAADVEQARARMRSA